MILDKGLPCRTIDERGNFETFNIVAERIFGYVAKEVIGKNVNLLMPKPTEPVTPPPQ